MIINEATDKDVEYIMNNDWKSNMEVIDYIHSVNKDFKVVGKGFYSVVFGKPGYKRLIKVNLIPVNNMKQGKGWAEYAKYCRRFSRTNPYLMKVYHLRELSDYTFIAVIEKLEPIRNQMDGLIKLANKDELAILYYYSLGDYEHPKREIEEYLGLNSQEIDYIVEKHFKEKHILSLTLLDLYNSIGPLDINTLNIMVRPRNKHLILSDPVKG